MIRNEHSKDESCSVKIGLDENHRVKRFLFVHELFKHYVSGKASGKEKRILSAWKPIMDKGAFPLPTTDEERDAEANVYRKVAEKVNGYSSSQD